MHYDLFHPLMCYDALFVVFVVLKLLADHLDFQVLDLPGVSSVFSDGNSDGLWSINTSRLELFTFEEAAIFVYSLQTGSINYR